MLAVLACCALLAGADLDDYPADDGVDVDLTLPATNHRREIAMRLRLQDAAFVVAHHVKRVAAFHDELAVAAGLLREDGCQEHRQLHATLEDLLVDAEKDLAAAEERLVEIARNE